MGLEMTHCNLAAPFNPILSYQTAKAASFLRARSSIFSHWTNTTLGSSENKCFLPSTVELSDALCIFIGPTKFGFTFSWSEDGQLISHFCPSAKLKWWEWFLCKVHQAVFMDIWNVLYRIWAFLHQIVTCKLWRNCSFANPRHSWEVGSYPNYRY